MIDEHPAIAIAVYLIGVIVWMVGLTAFFGKEGDQDAPAYVFFSAFWPVSTLLLIACIPFVIGNTIGKRFIHHD